MAFWSTARWAFVLGAISINACSLIDFDELTRDTGKSVGDSGSDATPIGDASSEGPHDASQARFCDKVENAAACLDFDDGELAPPPWSMLLGNAGERLTLSPSAASPPNAALFEVPAHSGARLARLIANVLLGGADSVEVAADVSIEELPSTALVGLLFIRGIAGQRKVAVGAGGSDLYLDVDDSSTDAGVLTTKVARPPGRFTVRLRTSFRGSKATSLFLNDVEVGSVAGGLTNVVGSYVVGVETSPAGTSTAARIRFDNIVVRPLPP